MVELSKKLKMVKLVRSCFLITLMKYPKSHIQNLKIVKLVRSCFLITLIKYLKSHRSLGLLFVCQKQKSPFPGSYLVVPGGYLCGSYQVDR